MRMITLYKDDFKDSDTWRELLKDLNIPYNYGTTVEVEITAQESKWWPEDSIRVL